MNSVEISRRKAIVTGASSGIGEAIAKRLAEDGAEVFLVARDKAALELKVSEIENAGGRAYSCAVDLADRSAAQRIVDAAGAKMGGIDILVNCASLTHNADFFTLTDDQWQDAFDVKVFAAIRLCRSAWPALCRDGGSIVNICGIGARTPNPFAAITAASSAAMMAITKLLADAGAKDGVQVNAINPGLVRTPRIERTIAAGRSDAEVESKLAESSRRAGAVRFGRPEDVASLVAYITSRAGSLLQGAIIDLDGGATKGL